VAQEAMQALAQNWRREMGVVVSDMSSVIPGGESPSVGQYQGHPANQGLFRELSGYRGGTDYSLGAPRAKSVIEDGMTQSAGEATSPAFTSGG
jgi:hypothetical protein